jgi:L-alanine-DL-glutamate epimerase-like enolase superfamily enzyme
MIKTPPPLSLRAQIERWPLAGAFTISRGSKTEAVVVTVEISDGTHAGRGECVPYARYFESPESVMTFIEMMKSHFTRGINRAELQQAMPAGAARNALDCALWDLQAKQTGRTVHELAGLPEPKPVITAYTISLDTPGAMAEAASKAAAWPLLKIKLGRPGDDARIAAVRAAAPRAELIVDANEGWTLENLKENLEACAKAGVTLIEQPLPEVQDAALATMPHPVPLCADESAHGLASLAALKGKYDAVNIKLDKAGGLTEALAMTAEAAHMGFAVMAGCMVATSLAVAPALLFAQNARVADLDGPIWLAKDREHGLRYDDHRVYPASKTLWVQTRSVAQ